MIEPRLTQLALGVALTLAAAHTFATGGSGPLGEDTALPSATPAEHDAPVPAVAPDAEQKPGAPSLERAFAFVPDPSPAPAWRVVGSYAASYAATGGAARPLAALSQRSGLVNELGAELGLHERLSLWGAALLAPPASGETRGQAAGRAALRVLVTDPGARALRLGLNAGYGRDFAGVSAPFVEATGALDIGRVRVGGMLHGEKALADGRDAVDFYAAAGVSVRTLEMLRVGAEYVGQDFEDAWEPEEAEGGVRHFAGLTLALEPTERIRVTAGPAMGLSEHAPRWLGRAALSYLF